MYHLDFCSPYIFWTSAAHVSCGLLQPHVSCGLLQPMSHLDFCSPCIFWTSAAHASFGFLLDLRRLLHECVFQNGFQKPSENSIKNQPKRHQKPSETGRRKSWKQPKGVGNFKRFSYFQANGFLGFRTNRSSIFFNRRMPWVYIYSLQSLCFPRVLMSPPLLSFVGLFALLARQEWEGIPEAQEHLKAGHQPYCSWLRVSSFP